MHIKYDSIHVVVFLTKISLVTHVYI